MPSSSGAPAGKADDSSRVQPASSSSASAPASASAPVTYEASEGMVAAADAAASTTADIPSSSSDSTEVAQPGQSTATETASATADTAASTLNGLPPPIVLLSAGTDGPAEGSSRTAAEPALPLEDGTPALPRELSNPSILSPTSTVCRGSYHQCGTARRVKVYELQNDSWFDRGTGYCAGVYDELRDEALLVARREEACTLLARTGPPPALIGPIQLGAGAAGGSSTATADPNGRAAAGQDAPATGSDASTSTSGPSTAPAAASQSSASPPRSEAGAKDGSPRRGGSSSALADASQAGAASTGGAPLSAPGSSGAAATTTEGLTLIDQASGAAIPIGAEGSSSGGGGDAAAADPSGFGLKPFESEYVIVVTEDLNTDDVILKSRVLRDDVYHRQAETLVVWTETDGTDMALSFQEAEGCHELWEFLTEVQKHFILVDQRTGPEGYMLDSDGDDSPTGTPNPNSPTHTLGFGPGSMEDIAQLIENFDLPEPNLASLTQIELRLKDAASKGQTVRDRVAEWLLKESYIEKLLPVFQDAEELESLDSLHLLCTIIQSILTLNDNSIFEHILQDDVFLGVVGMLEYDPEYPRAKASYRDYLSDPSRYRKVVEIKDESIVRKIHQTYRLLYLKDVILARVLDDPTFSILNSFVFYNQVDIVNYCVTNEGFLTELFDIFNPEKKEPHSRKFEAVFFLQQLCAMGKQIQLPNRITLYRTLTEWGLLSVVEYALGQTDQTLRNAAAEVLMTIIEYDANSVRLHILEQAEQKSGSKPLMTVLVDLLHSEEDLGLKTQMAEAVRVLLETNQDGPSAALAAAAAAAQGVAGLAARAGGAGGGSDPEKFLDWLYEAEIEHLFSPLRELPDVFFLRGGRHLDLVRRSRSALFGHLCDLLSFIMVSHSFRSQFFLQTSEISRRVASLLSAREKHIRLSALRFFKTCLNANNQFTNRHFTKIKLFGAVLDLVAAEANRDNAVSSACLEFFDFIRKENMKPVINHLMDAYANQLQTLADHQVVGKTFKGLVLQFHKNSEVVVPEADTTVEDAEDARRARDLRRRAGNRATMDADEESYFNEDDEEESAPSTEPAPDLQAGKVLKRQRTSILRSSITRSAAAAGGDSGADKPNGGSSASGPTQLVDYPDDDADDDTSVASSTGKTLGGDDADGASTASSSTTLDTSDASADALTLAAAAAAAASSASASASGVTSPPRLKRRRSQANDGSAEFASGGGGGGADAGDGSGGDEDALDRLAKKSATGSRRRSSAAAAKAGKVNGGSAAAASKGSAAAAAVGGEGKKKKKDEEEEELLEGGFIRVETPTSPTAAKTTNATRTAAGGGSSGGVGAAGSGAAAVTAGPGSKGTNGSKKITLALKGLGGKAKGSLGGGSKAGKS